MPRYFFDLHNDLSVDDQEGKDLPDDAAAYGQGMKETIEMVSASATEQGIIDLDHWVEVRREDGRTLTRIKFDDAVQFVRSGRPL